MSEKDIIELVQKGLDANQPDGYKVNVIPNDIEHTGRWWFVAVDSTEPEVCAYEFNQVLRIVENKIEDEHHLHVLLVPALVN